ncbi:WD repeat domain-containing protein [Phlyctema vagabunda]|uniref:WD repeat domain-containing protein n=1 Tax=Phlyctema vagabunda TaxID=108571 RepID=A0ABR4PQ35_9HELO
MDVDQLASTLGSLKLQDGNVWQPSTPESGRKSLRSSKCVRPAPDKFEQHVDGTEESPPSPADSGYVSSFSSPMRTKNCIRRCHSTTDVIEFQESSPVASTQLDGPSDEYKSTPKPMTLPRFSSRLNIDIKSPRRRPALKNFASDSNITSNRSTRSPDRFVPNRGTNIQSSTQSLKTSKEITRLTKDEKILRHNGASHDAFQGRRRATSPIPFSSRPPCRRNPSGNGVAPSVLTVHRDPTAPPGERRISVGTIWSVGGLAPPCVGVSNGRGGMLGRGTNAPFYSTTFSATKSKAQLELDNHEGRLASALDLDRIRRIFDYREPSLDQSNSWKMQRSNSDLDTQKTTWEGTGWVTNGLLPQSKRSSEVRTLPSAPFKVLDAPNLRDDFYCSVLAYSATCHTLAVGLGALLYAWSEMTGVHLLHGGTGNNSWLTSLAFSSPQGCKSILAFGRSDGTLNLMSIYDTLVPRFQLQQRHPIACLTWKPTIVMRPSRNPLTPGMMVKTEMLLVGDEVGDIYCYSIEWPDTWEVTRDGWGGNVTLSAKISLHRQQICGLSFSRDGYLFATGGNDNLCCLFETNKVLLSSWDESEVSVRAFTGVHMISDEDNQTGVQAVIVGSEKHRWVHGAAVKAIAFCPWNDTLVATGGGSNDKCIHFFHTSSGACLATISVAAQVTSLIWSTTRREIAATFGYAQPDHPYRIAVFSWPECKQVAAIPWEGEHRALFAIAYPGGPNESQKSREGGRSLSRTAREGCLVVASSDESVKFHEVWTADPKATTGGKGLLGGSDILEGLEGIDREIEVLR